MVTSKNILRYSFAREYTQQVTMSKSKLPAEVSKLFTKWGRKGGRNAAKALRAGKTDEQVSETMRRVATARWDKVREAATSQEQSK
jgi:hypothetical protein